MPKDDAPTTSGAGAKTIEYGLGFDESVTDVHLRLKQLLARWDERSSEEEQAWNEVFGVLLDAEEVRRRLDLAAVQDVDELVRKRKLLALPTRTGVLAYPEFQFDKQGRFYPALERIIGTFTGVVATPYTIAAWLRGPKDYLGGHTPMQWLELERDPEPVFAGAEVAAARLAH